MAHQGAPDFRGRRPLAGIVAAAAFAIMVMADTHWAYAVEIPTVPVGNAGNPNDSSTGYGGVSYAYEIATTEVTKAQYLAFLTAKAATSDLLGLYNPTMTDDPRSGITRSGSDGSYTFAAKENIGNKPVNFVSWHDAIRFANWLNNGQRRHWFAAARSHLGSKLWQGNRTCNSKTDVGVLVRWVERRTV